MNRAILRRVLIAAVLALGVATSATAQGLASGRQLEIGPRHELRASMGVQPATHAIYYGFVNGYYYYYNQYSSLLTPPAYYHNFYDAYELGFYYDQLKYYDSRIAKMPSVGLSYTYRAKRWCELGAVAAYTGSFNKRYTADGKRQVGGCKEHFLIVMPTVRFVWLKRDLVRMYSTLSVGVVRSWMCTNYDYAAPVRISSSELGLEIIPIGISVGRRVFGFAELGYSDRGWLNMGVGFRFNSKNDGYER